MRCVCPMGGKRTCPDDCPLARWAELSPKDRKAQRKAVSEKLYKDGFTMEQIAKQLGVSTMQISRDLGNFNATLKLNRSKTETNPKGAGRPKGSKKPRKAPDPHYAEDKVEEALDRGLTNDEIAKETGVGKRQVRHLVERINARRQAVEDAEPEIDAKLLSMSAQQKLAIAIRQATKKLEEEYEKKRDADVSARIKKLMPLLEQKEKTAADNKDYYQRLINNHKPIFTPDQFRVILMCLHPDGQRTTEKLSTAFRIFNNKKFEMTGVAEKEKVG